MATKPATALKAWATDALYTTGPKAGAATKVEIPDGVAAEGHRPGKTAPTAAEYWNWWLWVLFAWIDWLMSGSSAGAPDAHLVETTSTGRTQLQGLDLTPSSAVAYTLQVQTHASAGSAVFASSGNLFSDPTCYFASTGGGLALEVYTSGIGHAAKIHNNNAGVAAALIQGNPGLRCVSVGSNPALESVGSATSTYGATFSAANVSGIAARFLGSASATSAARAEGGANSVGLHGLGGTTSGAGILAEARANAANGVEGATTASATTAAAAVKGTGHNDGSGASFSSTGNGHAAVFTAEGNRATARLFPRDFDPATVLNGGIWYRTSYGLSVHREGSVRRLHDSAKGWVAGIANAANDSTSNDWTTPKLIATIALTGVDAPITTGYVEIEFSAEIGRSAGATADFGLELVDATAGVIIYDSHTDHIALELFQGGAGQYERPAVVRLKYPLPAAGTRTFSAYFYREGGGGGDVVRHRQAVFSVKGVY